MPVVTYHCPVCNQDKPTHLFPYSRGGDDGRPCRKCRERLWQMSAPTPTNDPRVDLLSKSRLNALKKGIQHTITLEDIPTPGRCAYLGTILDYHTIDDRNQSTSTDKGTSWRNPNLAVIDRIDSSKGYVPGNVQVISFLANCMKYTATPEQLLAFAEGILRVHGPK